MNPLPFISLAAALFFSLIAWRQRKKFNAKPYYFWFIYLHLAAVGLHQFEEYGWPGEFRRHFVMVFNLDMAKAIIPSKLFLEILNVFGFIPIFGLVGWLGTRIIWLGLGLLFVNFSNGFFHLVYSLTQMKYMPGTVTGTLLYLPLALFAARDIIQKNDIDGMRLLIAFFLGVFISFLPFIHVWLTYALHSH